jgi:hypothetical protein
MPSPDWHFTAEGGCLDSVDESPCHDGDYVRHWHDVDSVSHSFQRNTAGCQPIYHLGGANNLPYVEFDGVNDAMYGDGLLTTDWQCEWWFVVHPLATGPRQYYLCYNNGPTTAIACEVSPGPYHVGLYVGTTFYPLADAVTGLQLIRVVADNVAGTIALWRNGVLLGTAPFPTPTTPASVTLASREGAAQYFGNARFYEFSRYATLLSAANAAALTETLRAKYGIWSS